MKTNSYILSALALSSGLVAQANIPNPQPTTQAEHRAFPNTKAFRALRSKTGNNPDGIPVGPVLGETPISVTLGDIDNDGHDDMLFQAEQRLLMAVKVKDGNGQLLATPAVIWAYFDPVGAIYKHRFSVDRPAIADFDGDGLNEVAAVVGPAATNFGGSSRLVVIEGPASQSVLDWQVPDALIGASYPIDSIANAWTFHANIEAGQSPLDKGSNFNVQAIRVLGGGLPPEVFLSGTQNGRAGVLLYGRPAPGVMSPLYTRGYQGASAHFMVAHDIDQDGHDDILGSQLINLWTGCEQDLLPSNVWIPNVSAPHVDAVVPYDHDDDGDDEILVLHDGFDVLVGPDPNSCSSSLIWENSTLLNGNPAQEHGQTARIAKLVVGPDLYLFEGKHIVTAPKGSLDNKGSIVINGDGHELVRVDNYDNTGGTNNEGVWVGPFGPQLSLFEKLNFNGGPTEEILSTTGTNPGDPLGKRYIVWRLQVNPDPITVANPWPYRWAVVHEHFVPQGSYADFTAIASDFFGNANEDIVVIGRRGFDVVYNNQ